MKDKGDSQPVSTLTRRELLARGVSLGSWGMFSATFVAGSLETVRFFYPRVLFVPPSTFRLGLPDDFLARGEGTDPNGVVYVDERWKSAQRFFVIRGNDRLYALSARCAHLGCTVNWFNDLHIFKCPCHGSEYHSNGTNFAGPAPRPLDRLRIAVNTDGYIVVDTSVVYGPERFNVDDAFVRL